MTKLKNKKVRKVLHPDVLELLESEFVAKLAKTFPGARLVDATTKKKS
jgi:hypothetical protein